MKKKSKNKYLQKMDRTIHALDLPEWFEEYRTWLRRDVLEHITSNEEDIEKYLGKDSMHSWVAAVTHQSTDYKDNYEKFELLGDSIVKTSMLRLIMQRYPDLSVSQIDSLKNYYVSNEYFGSISKEIGLRNFIRSHSYARTDEALTSIDADLFEAMFGCLFMLTEGIIEGKSQEACNALLLHIMEDREISLENSGGADKSKVIDIFKFHLAPSPIERKDTDDSFPRIYVWIGPDIVRYFSKVLFEKSRPFTTNEEAIEAMKNSERTHVIGKRVPPGSILIGYGESETSDKASAIAYRMAWEHLGSIGFTETWYIDVKRRMDLKIPEVHASYNTVKEKLVDDGYEYVEFSKIAKLSDHSKQLMLLIGTHKDGSKVRLATVMGTLHNTYTKAALFDAYRQGIEYMDIREKVREATKYSDTPFERIDVEPAKKNPPRTSDAKRKITRVPPKLNPA